MLKQDPSAKLHNEKFASVPNLPYVTRKLHNGHNTVFSFFVFYPVFPIIRVL